MSAEEKKIKPETEAIIDNTRGTQPAKPKLVDPATLIETPAEAAPTPVPSPSDIFNDLEALREQSKMTVRRRSVLVNVFVVKHPANNKYFRCHPEKRMSLDATVIWDDRACYYVIPGMRNHPKLITRIRYVTLYTVVQWPEQQPVLWPVPVPTEGPGRDLPVWRSYRKAVELAQGEWVQMVWNDQMRDFLVEQAEAISAQPEWPKESFSELLKIGFEGCVVDNEDHPYLHILRGRDD